MEILYSVLILIVLVIIVIALYWLFVKKKAVVQHSSQAYYLRMTQKKYAEGEVASYRYVIFFSALLVSLMFATIMIEFPSFVSGVVVAEQQLIEVFEDELIDIPLTERAPSEPLEPPVQAVMNPTLVEKDNTELLKNEQLTLILDPQDMVDNIVDPIFLDTPVETIEEPIEEPPVITAEQKAIFPGGTAALMEYIYDNFTYFQIDINNGNKGSIYVKFVIEKDGSVSNVSLLKGINDRLNNEAIRVIQTLPRWQPARNGGRAVRMSFTLPIRLKTNNR